MIVPGFVFPSLMFAGALLLVISAMMQMKLLRANGLGSAKPFNVKDYTADQERMREMRATPAWKRMRLTLGAGAFLLIIGALMQLPSLIG